jgi:hypothetical protein
MLDDKKFLLTAIACSLAVLAIVAGGVVYSSTLASPSDVSVPRQVSGVQSNFNYTQTAAETFPQLPSDSLETASHDLYGFASMGI